MAAVFALAPAAFKAGMGALGLGVLGHQALKNVNLPGARPDVTADIFPPSRVKLGDSHRLEVIAAPENPKNALETAKSNSRAQLSAANNPLNPAAPLPGFGKAHRVDMLFKANGTEGPQDGGMSHKKSNNSSPDPKDPKDPKDDDYRLPAVGVSVGGAIYSFDRYLKSNDNPSVFGMIGAAGLGALTGSLGGVVVNTVKRPAMILLSGGAGAFAGSKHISESAGFQWVRARGRYEYRDAPFHDKVGGSLVGGLSAAALGALNPWVGLGTLAFSVGVLTDGYAGLTGVETRIERKNREYREWADTPGMYGE